MLAESCIFHCVVFYDYWATMMHGFIFRDRLTLLAITYTRRLVLCNKPIYRIHFAKRIAISVLKSINNEHWNIGISIVITILANIGVKWYYPVEVIGYFNDVVLYKYQKKSKVSHKYLLSTKLRKIDMLKISVLN